MLRLLILLLVAYGAFALMAFFLAERLIFQPPRASYAAAVGGAAPSDAPAGVRGLAFTRVPVGEGEHVAAQHLPAPDGGYTLLFSHGNAEDLGHLQPLFADLREAGFGVIGYDYRGYGLSSRATPTARAAEEDLEAVYRWAVDTLGIRPERLILHGRSVGSGPTMALAVARPAAGVVLESAFTSTFRVMTRVRLLPFDRFDNLARMRRLDAPVLVIHGRRDGIIPVWHGRRLFEEAPDPKRALWVEDAGHNDLRAVAGSDYVAALTAFADLIGATSSPSAPSPASGTAPG